VDVISGSGTAYRYEDAGGSNYTAPGEAVNWLVDDSPSGWIETQPDGLKYYYDSSGKMTKLVNHMGKVWTLTYHGGTSMVDYITNPASKRTTFHLFAAFGKIESIEDAGGRRTTLTWAGDKLTKITSPELCETSFGYDASGRLQVRTSPAGNRTTYSYDGSNRVTNVTYPDGGVTTYSYSGDTTIFTDQRGKVSTLVHNSDKYLETIIDPNGKRTTFTWTGGRLATVTNPLNNLTSFGYEPFSQGVSYAAYVAAPSAAPDAITTITYDTTAGAPPRVASIQYPDGELSELHWNATTNLKVDSIEDPLAHRTTYTYDATGNVTAVGNPLGETFTYQYDSQSRLEAVVNPLSQRTTFTYNAYSQVETIKNPLGKVWTITRDKMNRVTVEVDPLGNRTTYTYGSNCLVQTVKNPLEKVTTYQYTKRDQLEKITNPLGKTTTLAYDKAATSRRLPIRWARSPRMSTTTPSACRRW
jgi:YD repeat-containing protein